MTELQLFEGEPRPFLLTLDDYLAMDEAGLFEGRGRVELIKGVILQMAAQQTVHAQVKSRLGRRLAEALERIGSRFEALVEVTVTMPPDSAPEPDIAVIDPISGRNYVGADQAVLLVEVANTTAEHDLGRKAALYAEHAVPEYWVVEISTGVVHRHWAPQDDVYTGKDVVALGDPLASVTIDGLGIATDRLV